MRTGHRKWPRVLGATLVIAALLLAAFLAFAWRPAIDPIQPPAASGFNAQLVARGGQLASAGNCIACHTVAGGQPFAGGLPVPTPFGTIYSTNITPDAETGIGRWSQEAFVRSMRQGVDRRGSHLYPAFPYTHYTRVTDEDLQALYAYLMTRTPVQARARDNELAFPLGWRPLLAGWKLLFFEPGVYRADASRPAEWNRGAYLVEGLTHCSACHSPRNAFGAEEKDRYLAGGMVEGWYAPPLAGVPASPIRWSVDQLTRYLRTGLAQDHAIAGGPMQDVVHSLAVLPEADVRAIASYVQSKFAPATAGSEARARASADRARSGPQGWTVAPGASAPNEQMQLGAQVYATACASCHAIGRQPSSGSAMPLPLAAALYETTPVNLLNIVRHGIRPPDGERGRWMPGFAGALTQDQEVALLAYLRAAAAASPPWPDLAGDVKKASHP